MKFLAQIKNSFITSPQTPNPHGIPNSDAFTTLILGSPEDIITQYTSMLSKTQYLFQYANTNNSIRDYVNALMRYSAYSTASTFGVNLYFTNNKLGVTELIPEKLNRLLYGKFLFDIADFGWVNLLYTAEHFHLTEKFGQDEVIAFLQKEHISGMYWTLLFSFIVDVQNSDFAYQQLKAHIEGYEHFEPSKLDNLPSSTTLKAFDDMYRANIIGDPNKWCLFNAKHFIDTIERGPIAINKQREEIENSHIVKLLEPEVRLHLLSKW